MVDADERIDAAVGLSGARDLAELALLNLLQPDEPREFDLTIVSREGRVTIRLDEPDGAGAGTGEGASFAEAWHRIEPFLTRGTNDNPGGAP